MNENKITNMNALELLIQEYEQKATEFRDSANKDKKNSWQRTLKTTTANTFDVVVIDLRRVLAELEPSDSGLNKHIVSVPEGTVCLRANCKQHTADNRCAKGDDYDCLYRQTAR